MDDELRLLQEQFFAAQQRKSSVSLSERNVVELVLKLQQLGLLKEELLHTLNGKEYITQVIPLYYFRFVGKLKPVAYYV